MNPVKDSVDMLLQMPFRRWSNRDKDELQMKGKPTPILSVFTTDNRQGKIFCRTFNISSYQQHSWLCGSYIMQKLFCWSCLLIGHTNSVWNTTGYCDFKNLTRSIKIHESSKEHTYP